MPMNQEDYIALRDRVRALRPKSPTRPPAETPPGIELLRDSLAGVDCDEDCIAVAGLLAGEYRRFGMRDKEEQLLTEQVRRFPDKPVPQIALAGFLANVRNDRKRATEAADLAIRKSLKDGNFVRDAYHCRAEIAVKMSDYAALEDILVKLIAYRPAPGAMNVRYEDHFLETVPEGALDPVVLGQYRKLGRAKP